MAIVFLVDAKALKITQENVKIFLPEVTW